MNKDLSIVYESSVLGRGNQERLVITDKTDRIYINPEVYRDRIGFNIRRYYNVTWNGVSGTVNETDLVKTLRDEKGIFTNIGTNGTASMDYKT